MDRLPGSDCRCRLLGDDDPGRSCAGHLGAVIDPIPLAIFIAGIATLLVIKNWGK